MSDERTTRRWVILFTVIAVPSALGIETLLRGYVLPVEFEEVRSWLAPTMTWAAWFLLVLTAGGVLAGLGLQQALALRAARRTGQLEASGATPRASVGAFLLAASLPQAPAILAAFSFLLGASFLPVGIAVALSTVGVVLQALLVRR